MTRQNQIPSPDGERTVNALIPLWDMANHQNGNITTDFNLEQDCSECFALQNFSQGDQVSSQLIDFTSNEVRTALDYPPFCLSALLAIRIGTVFRNSTAFDSPASSIFRYLRLSTNICLIPMLADNLELI